MENIETEKLILKFKNFADKLAWVVKKRMPKSICFDDLQSSAYLGLISAAHNFNNEGKFTTYARYKILGSIYDYLREWYGRHEIKTLSLDMPREDGQLWTNIICQKTDRLQDIVDSLTGIEKSVVSLYYIDGLHMSEIGELLGVSKSRVSQIMGISKKTIRKMIA